MQPDSGGPCPRRLAPVLPQAPPTRRQNYRRTVLSPTRGRLGWRLGRELLPPTRPRQAVFPTRSAGRCVYSVCRPWPCRVSVLGAVCAHTSGSRWGGCAVPGGPVRWAECEPRFPPSIGPLCLPPRLRPPVPPSRRLWRAPRWPGHRRPGGKFGRSPDPPPLLVPLCCPGRRGRASHGC